MPALFINLKIEALEKFDFFKVTLSEVAGLFEEHHIKIRGRYASECVEYARSKLGEDTFFYQDLQERDWIAASLEMLAKIRSRSVFIYFEDHKLVASRRQLEQTLVDFDRSKLDYLCYSFFRASQLDVRNILPLGAVQKELFSEFSLNENSQHLIGRISPRYCVFSLISLVSVNYFKYALELENRHLKIYSRKLISVLTILFPYPQYRKIIKSVNGLLFRFDARLCISEPSSPFNLEKVWYELPLDRQEWRFGILKQELFANYDDDNGAYQESLIKRGLYPFDPNSFEIDQINNSSYIARQLELVEGDLFDCTYHNRNGRIRHAPVVQVNVINGSVAVSYQKAIYPLSSGIGKLFYANLGPVIQCVESAKIELKIFDELFDSESLGSLPNRDVG